MDKHILINFLEKEETTKLRERKSMKDLKKMITNIVFYLLILLIYIGIMIKQLK